jgi:hypothetical protein
LKSAFLALALAHAATAAVAQVGPSTLQMRCSQAAALVSSQGAVVLSTGPTTYDRYVNGGGFCERSETAEPAFVRTADAPQCLVGYICRELFRAR